MATPRHSSVPARLRFLREQAGLTQVQLAERAGLHLSAVTRFEQGVRSPTLESASALASALGVKVDDLLAPMPDSAGPRRQRGRPRIDRAPPAPTSKKPRSHKRKER
jgi:transcriptional regulator with XRE-family HTH domain